MSVGLLFWILMILWLLFGILGVFGGLTPFVGTLLLFALIFLLGWKIFGFIIQ